MDEKRFHIINGADNLAKYGIFCKPVLEDGETGEQYILALDLMELLNTLHEENEQLKKTISMYSDATKSDMREIKELMQDIEEIEKENEQLKKENYELHKRLGDFEPFEEYINERTLKTSLEDIIGIVKTDEPTNSVELKKELYK